MSKLSKTRDGWTTVSLGDVAQNINDYFDRENDKPTRFIAGEHIEEGQLNVRRWGVTDDGFFPPTFKRKFKAGDVLFHSRNIKKTVVPHFDGVTGEKLFVLRSKDNGVLLQDFLGHLLSSKHFVEYAVKNWSGSVNKFLNWRPLSKYEFLLPPVSDQARIVNLLSSIGTLQQRVWQAQRCTEDFARRFLIDSYQRLQTLFTPVPVASIGDAAMGRQKSPKYTRGKNPRPFLSVANIGYLEIKAENVQEMDFTNDELKRFKLVDGDILLTEGDLVSHFNVGRPAIFRGEVDECCFQNTLIRFRPGPDLSAEFALLLLEGARLNHVFAKAAKTTTVTHLGLSRFKGIKLPLPDGKTQRHLEKSFSMIIASRAAATKRLLEVEALKTIALQEIFG
ncbi:MAG: restriction endonuclease subunit S [Pseudomonadales bacterium]|nr:restriction endonuclease subunit S [Pseudomonadales bacterium]